MSRGKGTSGFSPVSKIGKLPFLISFSKNPKKKKSKHLCPAAHVWNYQFEGKKKKKTPNLAKESFILRKILLPKRSRTCKYFFLHIPLPPTSQSLKHSYSKGGYHPTTVFFPSSDLKTGPHPWQLSTLHDHHCRMVLVTGLLAEENYREVRFNRVFDT